MRTNSAGKVHMMTNQFSPSWSGSGGYSTEIANCQWPQGREERERKRKNRYRKAHHYRQNKAKLTQSYIPGSASRRVQENGGVHIWHPSYTAVIHRRPPEADRLPLALPAALHPRLPSGSHLLHYSFGSSAPFVMSVARVGADLFSSLPGPAAVPPEPNIWD